MKYFFSLILLSLVASCTPKKNTATYFGGKIINPKSNFVVLYKMDKKIDTFYLDKNNKFLKKLDKTPIGLYYFGHGNEHQYVYFEPQDSLLFRLNTWDFDESLVFSGKGAERNNILLEAFLENEKESKKFYKNYALSPTEMKFKIDSLYQYKVKKYNEFIENYPNEPNGFKKALNITLIYPLYSKLELYPRLHRSCNKNHTKELEDISSKFYAHRDSINTNIDSLMYFNAYSNYVTNYLYNLAYTKTRNFSPEFTVNLLKIINKEITSEKIRNELLNQTTISHFYSNSTCIDYNKAFFTFFKLCSDIENKKRMQRLVNDTKLEVEGNKLSNFTVIDFHKNKQPIYDLTRKKNTLLFFWTRKYVSNEYLISRVNYLKQKFPNIQFLLINIDDVPSNKINKLDIKTQFYLDNTSSANEFLSSKLPRTILVNSKGIITVGYASLNSNKLIKQLNNLVKN